ncbi:16S rRNA (cytosine(1402)-N(4))-methyltransferase RsmH [Candidatus Schneideria nysicola]|uniref:16S rRNA (cytosine(1402)-N(4))-methyltransferase RsmH n=1 Tax=Candidatus Schneideria nysicola TaxID=1081631 RepID=UPI001CAA6958|nr:16S rRNA (cytosine(1402)-N(4))-methyltransferase RsmH [Candidatus Schneideria nysicola]UAJ66318.1 16S rRNA (cytosine(1402)-N(4))-methyltransferase RsmH [Candidatus Schneideria nysicola]
MKNNYTHLPVLLNEVINSMKIKMDGIYLDCTFGRGGHSKRILSKLGENGRLLAVDRDIIAVEIAKKTIIDSRFTIIHTSFSRISKYLFEHNLLGKINGILLDLGVSSPQLDDSQRGFSFMSNGPLDMRMDQSQGLSAADWIRNASKEEITKVLKNFGQEKYAKNIAKSLYYLQRNHNLVLSTTQDLVKVIKKLGKYDGRKHPATRCFQAIRIHINQELEEIKKILEDVFRILIPGGILSVISYNSLEDKLIKYFMYNNSNINQWIPSDLPLNEEQRRKKQRQSHKFMFKISKKIRPSTQEIINNPRARSAILRIAEKISV